MEEQLEKDNFVKPEKTEIESKESNNIIKINEKIRFEFKKSLIDKLGISSYYGKIIEPKFYNNKCKENKNLIYVLK